MRMRQPSAWARKVLKTAVYFLPVEYWIEDKLILLLYIFIDIMHKKRTLIYVQ